MGPRALLVCVFALAGCDKTETVVRTVNLHDVPSCKIPAGTFGQYVATGDFEPAAFPNESQVIATDQPEPIQGVPADVQSLALAVEQTPSWHGVTLVPPTGDLDMLLLPSDSACSLVNMTGFVPGMLFAAVSAKTLIANGATTLNNTQPSYRADLGTGRVLQMTEGIGKPRLFAASVSLGDGRAIVSGGLSGGVAVGTAAIYDEAAGDFDPTTIQLQDGRAHHGAALLANGDVILAGGSNGNGLLAATERIHFDGTTWRSNEGTTPVLARPRNDPYVLALADGTVLVGGGTDASGPVDTIELFSADATSSTPVKFHARTHEAYVALEGGGALYVAAPDASDDPNNFQRAWLITPGGASIQVNPDVTTAMTDVKLFPRAGGGALLWTGSAWLAFDPWQGMVPVTAAPTTGPDASSPIASPDPGSRAWVAADGSVMVWRDDVRNAFATDDAYLTATSQIQNLAPDFFSPQTFDPLNGLHLDAGQTVWVADARYLDFGVSVDSIGESDSPPLVVLRTPGKEIEVGGVDCPYPTSAKGPTHVFVARIGASVFYALGGVDVPCTTIASVARVSLGIRGGSAGTHALDFSVARADAATH